MIIWEGWAPLEKRYGQIRGCKAEPCELYHHEAGERIIRQPSRREARETGEKPRSVCLRHQESMGFLKKGEAAKR